MRVFVLSPHAPPDEWESLYAALRRRGAPVLVQAKDGDTAELRHQLARRGFLDVVDGGAAGLELAGMGACA
jgi:hypothetical protein